MTDRKRLYDLLAAFPPLRPAAFFCCVVPPWLLSLLLAEPEPDFLPPRLEAPSELEMAVAGARARQSVQAEV